MGNKNSVYCMEQTMRWFGPKDPVNLSDLRQAGCSGVVTALHHIPNGQVWETAEIMRHKAYVEQAGLKWNVVESVPVHEDIKVRGPRREEFIQNYKATLKNLGKCGIKVVTYNFMPVLDWTRTHLAFELPNGAKALKFQKSALIAFDIWILGRPGAEDDYSNDELQAGRQYYEQMTDRERLVLQKNIIAGLPGSEESFTVKQFQSALDAYKNISETDLSKNLIDFVVEVAPAATEAGIKLAIHPDDPPYPIFGLPRVVSTASHLRQLFDALPLNSNGLCFCTGSLGVRPDNMLTDLLDEFRDRIHFLHLRSTKRNDDGDFYEDGHLEGDVDMYAVIKKVLEIQQEREISIPMRPDHGHQILDDLFKTTNPGYSAIGRLKGLAELRGMEHGLVNAFYRI